MKLLNLPPACLLLVALAIWTSPTAPAQSFEVETLTRSYTHIQPTTFALGYYNFQGNGSSSTYTRGQGATNLSYSYTGWWTTENMVSPNNGHLGYSMHSTNISEWSWDTANHSLYGAWFTEFTRVTNRYLIPIAPWVSDVATPYDWPRRFEPTLPPLRDLTSDFSGPVGTITTLYEDGATTTDTYTTTAGIFVPGDPASTNEHFYRVRLSLEYSDRTPISVPYFIASYLGQPIDSDTNVYVWLGEGKSYTAKPVFKTASPPSFYSYGAEVTPAQQLGTLVISTIAADPSWPGPRPPGIEARLGYTADDGDVTDDQIAFDVVLNGDFAQLGVILGRRFLDPILVANGIPTNSTWITSRGKLDRVTVADREWLTMVYLARSINPDPYDRYYFHNLEWWLENRDFSYRLANEFAIEASAYNSTFGHNVAGRHISRRKAKFGHTPFGFMSPVKLWFLKLNGQTATVEVNETLLTVACFAVLSVTANSPGTGHAEVRSGQKGSDYAAHICAGRAGWLLRQVEQPILRREPPDFSTHIYYRTSGDTVTRDLAFSGTQPKVWPTFFSYGYDFERKVYDKEPPHRQCETPFTGFMTLSPGSTLP